MSKYSIDGLLSVLPAPIANDEHLVALAEVAARALKICYENRRIPSIYNRIEELDSDILDILARDLKVDWYDPNYNLSVKRRLIRDNWYIHKRLGSVLAVETALSDVWPPSSVEEWFEYGGDPFHFRVILDAANADNPIYVNNALDRVKIFKPARSIMESNEPIIRVCFGIVIKTSKGDLKYHVAACGTNPRVATHGDRSDEQIVIEDMARSEAYHSPVTGQMIAGTHPSIATHGQMENDGLLVGASVSASTYTARPCGTSLNSLM